MSIITRNANIMLDEHGFLGVPRETFEQAGRMHFIRLLENGLLPESKVLEIGCGCLRIGYWLIRFLEQHGYAGFDPARNRVELGLKYLLRNSELDAKQPRFSFNADFATDVFNDKFDFFLACSIWTHCSKKHIQIMLDGFLANTSDQGVFVVSYLPPLSNDDDYMGEDWVGTSHESSIPGIVRHSLNWIQQQCDIRDLTLIELSGVDCDSQIWLRIEKNPAATC